MRAGGAALLLLLPAPFQALLLLGLLLLRLLVAGIAEARLLLLCLACPWGFPWEGPAGHRALSPLTMR